MALKKLFKGVLIIIFILAALAGALFVYARFVEPARLETVSISFESPLVSKAVRVAVFADTHIGNGTDSGKLKKFFSAITSHKPDIVVFLGDLYENFSTFSPSAEERAGIAEAFSLKDLGEGVPKYAVFGNHDLGGKGKNGFRELLEQAGWQILVNLNVHLEGNINLIGADDAIFGNPDISGLTDGQMYNVLLVHEPDVAGRFSGVELQLSGHSHGGQVNLPFLGAMVLPKYGRIYLHGLYQKPDGGDIYVTRGMGMSTLPFRFGARPELTIVDILPG